MQSLASSIPVSRPFFAAQQAAAGSSRHNHTSYLTGYDSIPVQKQRLQPLLVLRSEVRLLERVCLRHSYVCN